MMKINRRRTLQGLLGAAAASAAGGGLARGVAHAPTRAESLRYVTAGSINSLDPTSIGSTRDCRPFSMSIYDRLASFGKNPVAGGFIVDMDSIRGELAERIDQSPDGRALTFHIRQGATWHDGRAVTPADVKWSLDRGISPKTLSGSFFRQASLANPAQIAIVGDHQIEIKLDRPDRLILPLLCTPFVPMYNSELAKKHATAEDPWAIEWLKENTAAGGAYIVESFKSGQQVILRRNDAWKNGENGAIPFFPRVIVQTVPEAASRANLLDRGDADIAIDLANSDISTLEQRKQLRVTSFNQFNAYQAIFFGCQVAPFDNPLVRKAVAAALPYESMFQAAQFGRGRRLFGGTWTGIPESHVAQPWPLEQDFDKAKELLAEAGHAGGFETSFAFQASAAAHAEPMAALVQEALARIGIDVAVQKLADAQFYTAVAKRKLPMSTLITSSYFTTVEYITRTFFSGNQQFNYAGWDNKEVAELADEARYLLDETTYSELVRKMMKITADELPMALLWQPSQEVVTANDISGYTFWFHGQVDYRDLVRS